MVNHLLNLLILKHIKESTLEKKHLNVNSAINHSLTLRAKSEKVGPKVRIFTFQK